MLTLVVIAPRPETAERAVAAINQLAPAPPVASDRRVADRPRRTGRDGRAHLRRLHAVRALRRRAVHRGDPGQGRRRARPAPGPSHHAAAHPRPAGRPVVAGRSAVRLARSSPRWWRRATGCSSTPGRSTRTAERGSPAWPRSCRDGVAVSDIGWLRLTLWRELLAGLFDHPLLMPELHHIRRVRIDVSRPTSTMRISKAAFYAGWLAARLGWEVKQPLARDRHDEDLMVGSFRDGRREIKVELRAGPGHARRLTAFGRVAGPRRRRG